MAKNKGAVLGIIALIIGMSGLGLGVFTFLSPQDIDGPAGIEYPVSSEAEINTALTAIGSGYGIITITNDITLNDTININGGGNYIIQGAGAIVKCASTQRAVYITNATSLTLQNIKIDTTAVTSPSLNIIQIDEASDNHIYVRNVHIIGDDNTIGRGIRIDSDNVWVSECYFYKVRAGIWQSTGEKAHINDNTIDDCDDYGIHLEGTNNFIDGNFITYAFIAGIFADNNAHCNSISNNIIYYFRWHGIRIFSDNNTIVGNFIKDVQIKTSTLAGIYIDGSYNSIIGNGCYNVDSTPIGIGFGINIMGGTNNTVVGNTCLFNDNPFLASGSATNTYVSGNQFY
jgi:parallel beta-helix repeat protein